MKSKKAFLFGEHTVNILIAILCILILIGVGVKLYNMFKEKQIQVAQGHLNEISGLIDGIKEGMPREYIMLTPKGWILTGWPYYAQSFNVDLLPDICISNKWKNCFCICKTEIEKADKVLTACNLNSICKEVKYNVLVVNPKASDVNFPISVDNDLIESKKSLSIYLENKDKLVITTK